MVCIFLKHTLMKSLLLVKSGVTMHPDSHLMPGTGNHLKPKFTSDIRKKFFSVRIVDTWNNLPDSLHKANSIDDFKREYDSLFTS